VEQRSSVRACLKSYFLLGALAGPCACFAKKLFATLALLHLGCDLNNSEVKEQVVNWLQLPHCAGVDSPPVRLLLRRCLPPALSKVVV
jgi:hypothetical protein